MPSLCLSRYECKVDEMDTLQVASFLFENMVQLIRLKNNPPINVKLQMQMGKFNESFFSFSSL